MISLFNNYDGVWEQVRGYLQLDMEHIQAALNAITNRDEQTVGPIRILSLTSGTNATYKVPTNVYKLRVTVVGAGAGGAGGDGGSGTAGYGGGGGSGAVGVKLYETRPGTSFKYTIGLGGAGGAAGANAGASGGSTRWDELGGTVIASGGQGGATMSAGTSVIATTATTPATASGGHVNYLGKPGERGRRFSGSTGLVGSGADGNFGAGGTGNVGADGGAATGFGAGGGGGASVNTTDRAGGAGAPGVIIIEEF